MDRETFLLTREQIQARMEETRGSLYRNSPLPLSSGLIGMLPFVFSVLVNIFTNQKKMLLKTILTTLSLRFLSPFIARRVWGFFSKENPAIS